MVFCLSFLNSSRAVSKCFWLSLFIFDWNLCIVWAILCYYKAFGGNIFQMFFFQYCNWSLVHFLNCFTTKCSNVHGQIHAIAYKYYANITHPFSFSHLNSFGKYFMTHTDFLFVCCWFQIETMSYYLCLKVRKHLYGILCLSYYHKKYTGGSKARCKREKRDREMFPTNPQGLLKMVAKKTRIKPPVWLRHFSDWPSFGTTQSRSSFLEWSGRI